MSISEEVAGILGIGDEAFQDAMENAAPAPENGIYELLFRKLKATTNANKDSGSVTLGFEIVGGPLEGYRFSHRFWLTSRIDMERLIGFIAAAGLGASRNLIASYEGLEKLVGGIIFRTEITRTKGTKGGEFINLRCLDASKVS